MPSYIDKIVEGFPFLTISLIIGVPIYANISEIHMKLNCNAVLVQSNLDYRTLRIQYLKVFPTVFSTLSASIFVVPVNPGSEPIILKYSTGPQIADIRYAYHAATTLFNGYDRTDKALWQLLLESVEEMYVHYPHHR